MLTSQEKLVRKYFAVFGIYLVFSLIFINSNTLAATVSYTVSGNANLTGFRAKDDFTRFYTTSTGNVSLMQTDGPDVEFSCNNAKPNYCNYLIPLDSVDDGIKAIPFVLKQDSGTPALRNGNIIVDSVSPVINNFNVTKKPTGLLINYSVTDYLFKNSPNCSGIERIVFNVNNINYIKIINSSVCNSFGTYFINASGTQTYNVYMEVYDKVLNFPTTSDSQVVGGDFENPVILENFEIISSGKNLTTVSSVVDTPADFIVHIEDGNLDVDNVFGDFSGVNSNPAVAQGYLNLKGSCAKDINTVKEYKCIFQSVKIKPKNESIKFSIKATDLEQNLVTKTLSYDFNLIKSSGQLLYIGPDKSQCTKDLSKCYVHKLGNIFYMEFGDGSDYTRSAVTFGFDSTKMPGFCFLNDTWFCRSYYSIPAGATQTKVFVATPSTDDYGNNVPYKEKIVIVDDVYPTSLTPLFSDALNCSLPGETLKLSVKIFEDTSAELKIYVNSSSFSTKDIQTGTCTNTGGGEWDCELPIDSLASQYTNIDENVIVEDLAGNKLPLKHTFEICEPNSNSVPNVISSITQKRIPLIDRRTASFTQVKTYIPLTIKKQSGATIIGVDVDRCWATDINGLDILGTDQSYFLTQGNNPILALYVGHDGVILPDNQAEINCTINARIRIGPTVFIQPEQETFKITLNTFNNPLGTVDATSELEIATARAHLKDLNGEIKTRQIIDNTLGLMCKIAETLGQINSLLQAVKSLIYGVLIVIDTVTGWTGVGAAIIEAVWPNIQISLGGFHSFVNQWIWPTGIIPVSLGTGAFIKWGCMLYTCKHLDFGTYLSIGLDTAAVLSANNIVDKNSLINVNSMVKDETTYKALISNGYNGLYTESFDYGDETYYAKVTPSKTVAQDQIEKNTQTINGVGAHKWLLNPYLSTHFDDTCAPAILYNTKKERQIECKYISCLEKQAQSGLPKAVCDLDKKYNTCLYLDSAEYLSGGNWNSFFKGLGDAVMNNLLGIAFSVTYLIYCWNYYMPLGYMTDVEFHTTGWHSSLCGLTGAWYGLNEITSFIKNPLPNFGDVNLVPAGKDYCEGVDV